MNDDFKDEEMNEEEDFAAMFEASLSGVGQQLIPGQKIEGTILQIGKDWSFLDVGQKGEGVLATAELLDANGEAKYAAGDKVAVFFLSRSGGELRFTTKVGGGSSGSEQLENAYASRIPVEGRIEKEIKGGYEVKLAGNIRAFCPFSQTGLRLADPAELIGTTLSFRITQYSERGRNIVVSHRALLEAEREQQRESLKQSLKEGQVVSGQVTNLLDFGAFVDIGGLEGLVPISEISYGRVDNISDILQVGQRIDVAIKKIDWENNKFSFSVRDTLADPWKKVGTIYKVGGQYPGKVSRLAQFGAFVTLEDGIDGLLHISKMAEQGQRVRHPQDVVQVGQELSVKIDKIDQDERRISLALSGSEEPAGDSSYSDAPTSSGMGSLGDLLKAAQQKKERKKKK